MVLWLFGVTITITNLVVKELYSVKVKVYPYNRKADNLLIIGKQ